MIICFPHPPGSGGPGTFQRNFEEFLKSNGYNICYKNSIFKPDLIFIVGGTRHIFWLIRMKINRIPVIYRLDGIPWLHRRKRVGFIKYLNIELGILVMKFIHAFLADYIIYQSEFVRQWWDKKGWRKIRKFSIIYNGVSLPSLKVHLSFSGRIVVLEGNIDYSPYAVNLLNDLSKMLPVDFSIHLYGNFENKNNISLLDKRVSYHGYQDHDKIFGILTGSIYLSLDVNPACPNTVIEAMACGAPVVAFDTGSLREIVNPESGILVPYGSDPWELHYPDVESLVDAILKIKNDYNKYSNHARDNVEKSFMLNNMANKYIRIIEKFI